MKFFNLLKKEVSELFTKQTIISMVFTVVLLIAMGQLVNTSMQKAIFSTDITIIDCDKTDFTGEIMSKLGENGFNVNLVQSDIVSDNIVNDMKKIGADEAIIIPQGFTDTILKDKKPAAIKSVCTMKSTTSVSSTMSGAAVADASSAITKLIKEKLYADFGVLPEESEFANSAVEIESVTIAGDRTANASVEAISSVTMMRNMIVLMMIFILVLFASQMIITAIATEKIDKTLETLLSTPVSRMTIILSKMTAAALVSIINAVAYMIGFSGYMSGFSAGMSAEEVGNMVSSGGVDISEAIEALNFGFNAVDFVLIGLQMFVTILIALSISIILGALAKDAKSTQTLIMPIMIAIMLPFIITLLGGSPDEMSMPVNILISAIPFTHTFRAIDYIAFGNMTAYWLGLAYQIVFLAVCMALAVRIFTTDKIFTVSLNFSRKKQAHIPEN
ncbi:MAG: ABC transporter permease [Oscillospiraceae bacterium]